MADVRPVDWQSAFPGAVPGLAVYDMGSGRLWGLNQSTPFPLASVAKLIIAVAALAAAGAGRGQILTGRALEIVWEALRQQEDQDSLFAAPGRWLHMTGGFEGVCNDVGILLLPDRWVICSLFVSGDPQGDWNELRSAMQGTGHRLYAELSAR